VRVADTRGFAAGAPVAVSVRPHRIAVVADGGPAAEPGWNRWPGAVTRVVYFGDALDVQVAVPEGGAVLRLTAPPGAPLAVGQPVALGVPPEACVVLPPD